MCLSFCLYGCGFLSGGKSYRGVKFCVRVGILSGQVFSSFGEHWFAGSHGGGSISRRPGVGSADRAGRHLCLRGSVFALGIAGGGVA